MKKYADERITSSWGLWDNLFNYDNALRAAQSKGVTLIQDIKDEDSHFKLGNMDIQLYNYKNEYGPDGKLKKVLDDNSNSIVAVVTVAGKKIYLGGDINLASTKNYLQEKNIQVVRASSKTQDATVFDISNQGFTNVSNSFPDIPKVDANWYQEGGYWKYRLSDRQMAIGWQEIDGATYFFNGKGQKQTSRWLH